MIKLTERQFQILDLRNNPLNRLSKSLRPNDNIDQSGSKIGIWIRGSEIRGFRNLEARGLGRIISIAPSYNCFFEPSKDLINHVDAIVTGKAV